MRKQIGYDDKYNRILYKNILRGKCETKAIRITEHIRQSDCDKVQSNLPSVPH